MAVIAAVALTALPASAGADSGTGLIMSTFAGRQRDGCVFGGCGDGGPAIGAGLNQPWGVAVGGDATVGGDASVYIADTGDDEIRRVSPSGFMSTVAGNGNPCDLGTDCGDGDPAAAATLNQPEGVTVNASGNVYIADTQDNRIRKVTTAGVISTVVGTGHRCDVASGCGDGGPATAATLFFPAAVAFDQAGDMLIADSGDAEIRKVTPSGTITTVAGNGTLCWTAPACGDGGPATQAELNDPTGVAVDQAGSVYIADPVDEEVRRVAPDGTISRFAGTGSSCTTAPRCGDGPAGSAQLTAPTGVTVVDGSVVIADNGDNEIRVVTNGLITTYAGNGTKCDQQPACDDGQLATNAELDEPQATAVGPGGRLYIADSEDEVIRLVAPGPLPPAPSPVPVLSRLRVSPQTSSLAGRRVHGSCVARSHHNRHRRKCRRPIEVRISYEFNVAASANLWVERGLTGRMVLGSCLPLNRRHRHDPPCTYPGKTVGGFSHPGAAGVTSFTWNGQIGNHRLRPGKYFLLADPLDPRFTGEPEHVAFTIKR